MPIKRLQIDRKQRFFKVQGLYFAHWENRSAFLGETLLDGELVIDIDPSTGAVRLETLQNMAEDSDVRSQQTLMYYAFDCMLLHGENIMEKPLLKRYAVSGFCSLVKGPHIDTLSQRLQDWVIKPFAKAVSANPDMRRTIPFM